jgi:hypothetical protein
MFTFLNLCSNLASAKDYHVTVDGTPEGDGSMDNPWDLQTALDKKSVVQPGDTLYLHEGTYRGRFSNWLEGDASGHIKITNYQDDIVIIDGAEDNIEPLNGQVLNLDGAYIILEGFTITNSNPTRTTDIEGSFPLEPQNVAGLRVVAPYSIVRNMIIRDNHSNAIGLWNGATDAEVTGNLLFYNGWDAPDRGHAYGLYVQNEDPNSNVRIHDNIIFANFSKGTHVYVTNGEIISNIHINDNISFEAGLPSSDGAIENNIFVGGLVPLNGIEIMNNHTYLSRNDRGNCIRAGYYEQDNQNVTLTGNYMTGGYRTVTVRFCENTDVSNNFVFNKSYWLTELIENGQNLDSYKWDDNRYYYTGSRSDLMDGTSWSDWRTTNRFDLNSEFTMAAPDMNEYFLKYYAGNHWASLVIYDRQKLNSVDVDLSSLLTNGSQYQIYDVQNIDGDPVLSGTYDGSIVQVPTNLTAVTPVFGDDVPSQTVHTPQEFNVYIVKSSDF